LGWFSEDHDKDDSIVDELDVNVGVLALVELRVELVFTQQLGHPARGSDVAGRERRERGRVDLIRISSSGDELAVLVDNEDDTGIGGTDQSIDDRLDLPELLLVHHHLRVGHPILRA
jgi:hypothetical protein